MGFTDAIGQYTKKRFQSFLQFYLFSIATMSRLLRFRWLKGITRNVFYRQVLFTGFDALGLMGIIAVSTSVLIILEVNQLMGQLGKGMLVYKLLVFIVVQQLSSLFTTMVVIARSGTAIATELGNMVVHHEIDLLRSFGISPLTYLAVPRVAGMLVSIAALTLYFNALAVVGGAVFSNLLYGVQIWDFFNRFVSQLAIPDFFMAFVKSLLFGTAVGIISCHQGLKVENASTEVPQRTMHSVVYSFITVIVLNIIVTLLYL